MDKAAKDEIKKTLEALPPPPRPRWSSLAVKTGAGYLAMAVFTIAALAFSSFNLFLVKETARDIANVELPAVSALVKMRSSLLAQEGFAGKYAILRDNAFVDLFHQRESEAAAHLAVLEKAASIEDIAAMKQLYRDYQSASHSFFEGESTSREESKASALLMLKAIDEHYVKRQDALKAMLKRADEHQKSAARWGIMISGAGFVIAISTALFFTYRISSALEKLQKATHRIAQGDFTYDPQVSAVEEISDLANDFNEMAAMIKKMEQVNVESRALTRLPGNLAIERVLGERLKEGKPFALCHINLENFKPFCAQYGYVKGSHLLTVTGYLLHGAVNDHGAAKDFVGHAGGDHFVMVLSADKVAPVCDAVVAGFDAEVVKHYTAVELQAGGIERLDHQGVSRFSPITTISITVINCGPEQYASAVEICRAAADMTESVPKTPGSSNWIHAS